MNEKAEIRVKFKIGEIEFEAEGSADLVERERSIFSNTLLPSAIDAIVRTRGIAQATEYIDDIGQSTKLLAIADDSIGNKVSPIDPISTDLSRTSLASFIQTYGILLDQDFVLIAAYYDEKKNNIRSFTSESVKQYYADARRQKYSNFSELLKQLTQKGFIMDDPDAEKKIPKQYILTDKGIQYVEKYQPKENMSEKPKASKPKRPKSKQTSVYATLCADDLNLKNYPEVKIQNTFKKQMILLMYIVSNEGKGEFFSVADIQFLMTDMLGLHATDKQIGGIFDKNRTWFKSEQDPDNKKAYKRKLLQGAKDFAEQIIAGTAE